MKKLPYRELPFLLLVLSLAAFLVFPELVQQTMYNDGVWYATISRNLAEGKGSFWFPYLSQTVYPRFHEHPPLVFGLQSLFFHLLGDSHWTERIYALLIFGLSAWLIVSIWRRVCGPASPLSRLWFLPLSLWLINEVVTHFYPANILEDTLGLFTLAAVWRLTFPDLRKGSVKNYLDLLIAGLLIFGASLCKGFVGLFPLAFFFWQWIFFREMDLRKMVWRSGLLLLIPVLMYAIFLLNAEVRQSLGTYLNTQVLASLTEARTEFHHRDNRLYIIRRLLEVMAPAVLIAAAIWWLGGRKKIPDPGLASWRNLLLAMGVSASVPLMLSPKQSYYYLLPAIPYFALGLGLIIAPGVEHLLSRWPLKSRSWYLVLTVSGGLCLAGIGFALSKVNTLNSRDRQILPDIRQMAALIGDNQTVSALIRYQKAPLVGYMARFYRINIDTMGTDYPFLILEKEQPRQAPPPGFEPVPLTTAYFQLYRRRY